MRARRPKTMFDAVDELIAHRKESGTTTPMLDRVLRFHQINPGVLDFLVTEMRVDRANGWTRTSLGSLWHYSRWVLTRVDRAPGESFVMSNNLFPAYGRIIVILHPDLNGFFGMATSNVDAELSTRLEPRGRDHKTGQIRRLLWRDGTPIESGWRPSLAHSPKPVPRRERVQRVAAIA